MASKVSVTEPKLIHSSIAIITRLSGTTSFRRAMASCRLPNSPTHSIRNPGGNGTCSAIFVLRLLDGAAEVAVAHAEFDRQIALLLFAINIGGAGQQIDRRDVGQGNLHQARPAPAPKGRNSDRAGGALSRARGILHRDLEVSDVLQAFPELRREAHDNREMPVAVRLVQIAGRVAADRHFDGRVDVAGAQPVTRGALAIDVDLHGRLAERGERPPRSVTP